MIIFLTGPTGSGKTDNAWALVSMIEGIVFLDCDWFASRAGFAWSNASDVDSVYRAIESQMAFHIGDGRTRFVVTLTLGMAHRYEARLSALTAEETSVHAFRLSCRPDLLRQRITSRGRDQYATEIENAVVQSRIYDELFPGDRPFRRIDTSDIPSEAVAAEVVLIAGV